MTPPPPPTAAAASGRGTPPAASAPADLSPAEARRLGRAAHAVHDLVGELNDAADIRYKNRVAYERSTGMGFTSD